MEKKKQPVIFVGHGSPMNIIEDNDWTRKWKSLGERIGKVDAIAMISAHWYTKETYITSQKHPETIYDMYGFPKEIYDVVYDAVNLPKYRDLVKLQLGNTAKLNSEWGYDHGTYSVLLHMYPKHDIPLLQISVDMTQNGRYHFDLGKKLAPLREKNILIMGSGNIVHNLYKLKSDDSPYPWAELFNNRILELVKKRDWEGLFQIENEHDFKLAAPTAEHYYPLIWILGASDENDNMEIFNNDFALGSVSMTGIAYGI